MKILLKQAAVAQARRRRVAEPDGAQQPLAPLREQPLGPPATGLLEPRWLAASPSTCPAGSGFSEPKFGKTNVPFFSFPQNGQASRGALQILSKTLKNIVPFSAVLSPSLASKY